MVSLIYALHSPSNLSLSSFSATADFTVLKVSAHWTPVTSHGAKTCPLLSHVLLFPLMHSVRHGAWTGCAPVITLDFFTGSQCAWS